MTALSKRKTRLLFETSANVQGRALLVNAGTHYVTIWQKGIRTSKYRVSWESIFLRGAQIEADRQMQERQARRRKGKRTWKEAKQK